MSERLPIPPELEHLIEKREQEADRRQKEQRSGADQRTTDLGPLGAVESAKDISDVPTEDRRLSAERRQSEDRRKKPRRQGED